MTPRARALATVVALWTVSTATYGFWSRYGLPVHQDMTAAALAAQVYRVGSGSYAFSSRAIDAINQMHAIVDSNVIMAYQPTDHFDSETLRESYGVLATRRQNLIDALSASPPQADTAWLWLGLMIHQVQDFYSHSTWVYLGNTQIIDFGSYTLQGLTPPGMFPLNAIATGNVCAGDGKTVDQGLGVPLASGYFPPTTPPAGYTKCNHGDVFKSVQQCLNTSDIKDGMNLDGPGRCQIAANIARADTAQYLAINETVAFAQSIISQLESMGNPNGICMLLDSSMNFFPSSGQFPFALPITTQVNDTFTKSDGTVTVNNYTVADTVLFNDPRGQSAAVFGTDGNAPFIGCGTAFPARSGSVNYIATNTPPKWNVTLTISSGGGSMTITSDAVNTVINADNACPANCTIDNLHAVETWQYQIATGAYTITYSGSRHFLGTDPSTGTQTEQYTQSSGTASGTWAITIT